MSNICRWFSSIRTGTRENVVLPDVPFVVREDLALRIAHPETNTFERIRELANLSRYSLPHLLLGCVKEMKQ